MSSLSALLERAGAVVRGCRADCPECRGKQTVAYDEEKGLFCCHKYGCAFRGGLGSLHRRLGAPKYTVARPMATAKTDKTPAQEKAVCKAAAIWKAAMTAPANHAYLQRKRIQPHGARLVGNALCLAGHDLSGAIRSLQFIAQDGRKRFLRGASPKGCMFPVDGAGRALPSRLWIAEGFATACTITDATGQTAICAFSAGNLLPVCRALLDRYPQIELVIAADNDHLTPGNPGIAAAKVAARAARCHAVWPPFSHDDAGTDWNDFANVYGIETVRRMLAEAL